MIVAIFVDRRIHISYRRLTMDILSAKNVLCDK